ncbi:hypothetical protein DFH11DRAFT_1308136 [Phellopilus nigrolimitatus]|nr:hypothetical protein DFH11DRAFT_1308136 [Phellopilus nigrolimitatus]
MSITNPTQLVAEFKKSGEFDRLRRELLSQFKNEESITNFTARVQDIVQQRLRDDAKLQYLGPDAVHAELMQEMDRFPLVERTVADLPALSDPSFSAGIRRSLTNLLRAGPGQDAAESEHEREDADMDVDMDESDSSESDSSDEEKDERVQQDTGRLAEPAGHLANGASSASPSDADMKAPPSPNGQVPSQPNGTKESPSGTPVDA